MMNRHDVISICERCDHRHLEQTKKIVTIWALSVVVKKVVTNIISQNTFFIHF